MTRVSFAAAALLRGKARRCRLAALKMQPSPARVAVERIAARWEMMAEAEGRPGLVLAAANEP